MDAINTQHKAKLHPVMWVAAVALTLFSAFGIAAITGLIPSAGSKSSEPVAAVTQAPQSTPAGQEPAAQTVAPCLLYTSPSPRD